MARYTGPKKRIARRFGLNLFGTANAKKNLNPDKKIRQHPPGMHGAARRKKKSDYCMQLEEQQKLKAVYGMISQKQLVNYYKKALAIKGNTVDVFQRLLECRLDTVVFRLGLTHTPFAAQQIVSHGHIQVNGKRVNIRSFQVKPGDVVSVKEGSVKKAAFAELIRASKNQWGGASELPAYLQSEGEFSGKLIHYPEGSETKHPVALNVSTICEHLAHRT